MAAPKIVDADGHLIEPDQMWIDYLEEPRYHELAPRYTMDKRGRRRWLMEGQLQPAQEEATSPEYIAPSAGGSRRGGFEPEDRLKDQDDEEIDIAVLFPTIGMRLAGLKDPGLITALCKAYNNWCADFCKTHPDRFAGVAVVALQDVQGAIAETRRAVEKLGHKAIMVRPNPIYSRTLDHPAYDHLWETVQDLGIPLCVHEGTHLVLPTSGADRFDAFIWKHVVDHPHEQQIACTNLIGGGTLEKFPNLTVGFMESGAGWIAHWLERMDAHFESYWGKDVQHLTLKPSEYFVRQCFISADPMDKTLPAMAELVGDDVIVWASDYPHPDGMFPGAARQFETGPTCRRRLKIKILGENAIRFYNL